MRATILLIDDVEDSRDLYGTYLRYRGLDVICAADAAEGISFAKEHRPDVILMDIRLPGMTGTEAMQLLRADPSFAGTPIVALTAHALREERDHALRAGFDEVIAKPCLPDELFCAITVLLSKRRDRRR